MAGHTEAQNAPFGARIVIVNINGIEHTLMNTVAAKYSDQLNDATDGRPELLVGSNAKVKEAVEQNLYRSLTGDYSR
jgi:hypothetical protein